MEYFIILIIVLMGCVVSANQSSQPTTVYNDGCYYLVTPQGGITAKVNQPTGCKE